MGVELGHCGSYCGSVKRDLKAGEVAEFRPSVLEKTHSMAEGENPWKKAIELHHQRCMSGRRCAAVHRMARKSENMRAKMLKEFKDFISKGNVMDLAVGIIIGAAFTAIVGSLVDDLITPLIGIFMGGIDFSGLSLTVGGAMFAYGKFIMALINFLIIAWVVFMLVKTMNKIMPKPAPAPEAPKGPTAEELLVEIRDALKKK
jgi:large conductance mechanosensitive channel